jgi:hypothetical protein
VSLRFPFQPVPFPGPAPPTLPPGTSIRWRPLIPVTIRAPETGRDHEYGLALLDTGSQDTIFPIDIALSLGVRLLPLSAVGHQVRWRGTAYPLRFGAVQLELSDGTEKWTWPTMLAFTRATMPYPMLGQAGFLEFMNATFHGEDHFVTLDPTPSFPGTVS